MKKTAFVLSTLAVSLLCSVSAFADAVGPMDPDQLLRDPASLLLCIAAAIVLAVVAAVIIILIHKKKVRKRNAAAAQTKNNEEDTKQ